MATHCLVTMPVVNHSQARIKWAIAGWNVTERCARLRCRYNVTHTIVMCVSIRVYNIVILYLLLYIELVNVSIQILKWFGSTLCHCVVVCDSLDPRGVCGHCCPQHQVLAIG